MASYKYPGTKRKRADSQGLDSWGPSTWVHPPPAPYKPDRRSPPHTRPVPGPSGFAGTYNPVPGRVPSIGPRIIGPAIGAARVAGKFYRPLGTAFDLYDLYGLYNETWVQPGAEAVPAQPAGYDMTGWTLCCTGTSTRTVNRFQLANAPCQSNVCLNGQGWTEGLTNNGTWGNTIPSRNFTNGVALREVGAYILSGTTWRADFKRNWWHPSPSPQLLWKPAVAEVPAEEPRTYPLPDTFPKTHGITEVNASPRARAQTQTQTMAASVRGNGPPRIRPAAPYRAQRPLRREKEKKINGPLKLMLWALEVTELNDLVDCLVESIDLPRGAKPVTKRGLHQRMAFAYRWMDYLDGEKFVTCVIANAIEDAIVGGVAGKASSGLRAMGRPVTRIPTFNF